MNVIFRSTALSLGLSRYFLGIPCPQGHISERLVRNYECVRCKVEATSRRARNISPEKRSHRNTKARLRIGIKRRKKIAIREQNRYQNIPNYLPRKEAVKQGLTYYFTGRPCKNGHIAERLVATWTCVECRAISRAKVRAKTKQKGVQQRDKYDRQKKIEIPGYISLQEARQKGLTRYFTGVPCRRGHVVERSVAETTCIICLSIARKAKKQRDFIRNPKKVRALRRAARKRQKKTPAGQFMIHIRKTQKQLFKGNSSYHRVKPLGYGDKEFVAHLKTTAGMSINAAKAAGYHLDHIVPIAFIRKALAHDLELAFQVCMDLKNLRMIPGDENTAKSDKLDMDSVQEPVFFYLGKKYGVLDHFLSYHLPF